MIIRHYMGRLTFSQQFLDRGLPAVHAGAVLSEGRVPLHVRQVSGAGVGGAVGRQSPRGSL